MRIFCFLFLSCFFMLSCFGQNINAYIHVRSDALHAVSDTTSSLLKKSVRPQTKNSRLNKMIEQYDVGIYKQAFPTAHSKWLRDIYYVETPDVDFYNKLNNELREEVDLIETIDGTPQSTYTPNDYGKSREQDHLDLIRAKEAWDIVKDIPKLPVGITDTYFETSHEDMSGQFLNQIANNYNSGDFHGTAVSGLIAAITDNDKGIAGLGFNTKVYASTSRTDSEVLRIAQLGYKVINCSWYNLCNYSVVQDSLYKEIRNIWDCVVVFGAGNGVQHCGGAKIYPASLQWVISVTSIAHAYDAGYVHPTLGKIGWKDRHEYTIGDSINSHHHNDAVDICAPGYAVTTPGLNSQYKASWGTSFAAPLVAATVGLVRSINPCLTARDAMDMVINSSDPSIYDLPENFKYRGRLGKGRLDVYKAVLAAAESATIRFKTSTTIWGIKNIRSNYAIISESPVVLSTGSNVKFETRQEVVLDSGFEVKEGADFEIAVDLNLSTICE